MCVCVCVYICVYIYIYIYTHTHTHTHTLGLWNLCLSKANGNIMFFQRSDLFATPLYLVLPHKLGLCSAVLWSPKLAFSSKEDWCNRFFVKELAIFPVFSFQCWIMWHQTKTLMPQQFTTQLFFFTSFHTSYIIGIKEVIRNAIVNNDHMFRKEAD